MIGKLPETKVLGDTFEPYVIIQTSHNGMFNVKATISPLRFVCQNQFAWTFKHIRNTVNIRHSRVLPNKIAQAQTLIRDTAIYMEGFTNTAEELALLKIDSKKTIYEIMDAFFESTKKITERQQKALAVNKQFFMECYDADDNSDYHGTVWGLANAMTDYITHKKHKNTTYANDNAFMRVTFDTEALNRFIEVATAFAR